MNKFNNAEIVTTRYIFNQKAVRPFFTSSFYLKELSYWTITLNVLNKNLFIQVQNMSFKDVLSYIFIYQCSFILELRFYEHNFDVFTVAVKSIFRIFNFKTVELQFKPFFGWG